MPDYKFWELRREYQQMVASPDFHEKYPALTGVWEKDMYKFLNQNTEDIETDEPEPERPKPSGEAIWKT